MKKILVVFCAIIALAACAKVTPVVEEPAQEANKEIKVNIKIFRAGIDDTKASVKTTWAVGDVVFLFFKGVETPKHLKMTYSTGSGSGEWTASIGENCRIATL